MCVESTSGKNEVSVYKPLDSEAIPWTAERREMEKDKDREGEVK